MNGFTNSQLKRMSDGNLIYLELRGREASLRDYWVRLNRHCTRPLGKQVWHGNIVRCKNQSK